VNCFSFSAAVFVHVGPAKLCTENGVLFYMFLRPKDPVVLDVLAQLTRPRETRCKTSCAKCFVKLTFILYFN